MESITPKKVTPKPPSLPKEETKVGKTAGKAPQKSVTGETKLFQREVEIGIKEERSVKIAEQKSEQKPQEQNIPARVDLSLVYEYIDRLKDNTGILRKIARAVSSFIADIGRHR